MTVAQLKRELEKYDDDMDIMIHNPDAEFTFSLLNTLSQKTIRFCEDEDDPNREPFADDECLILYTE